MGGIDPSIFLLIGFLLLMYFLIIRPQSKRAREHRDMVAALKEGDEVVTNGGLVGVVRHLNEQYALIETGEAQQGKAVRIQVQRSAIATLLPRGSIGLS